MRSSFGRSHFAQHDKNLYFEEVLWRWRRTAKKIWVTLTGLPLTISLEWPFHRSTSGADFWVLHGDIRLENSEGLHAPVAVNLSATVREVLPSLDAEGCGGAGDQCAAQGSGQEAD